MRSRSRTQRGIQFLVAALALSIAVALSPYIISSVLIGTGQTSTPLEVYWIHAVLIPWSFTLVYAAIAVLGLFGFIYVRQRGTELDLVQQSRTNRAASAMMIGAAAAVANLLIGLWLGLAYLPGLVPPLQVARGFLSAVLAIGLGLFLYWTIQGRALRRANLISLVALSMGVGSAAAGIVRSFAPEVPSVGSESPFYIVSVVGSVLGIASLILWLAVYVWTLRRFRSGEGSRPTIATTG